MINKQEKRRNKYDYNNDNDYDDNLKTMMMAI
jgi:hypothetical protein